MKVEFHDEDMEAVLGTDSHRLRLPVTAVLAARRAIQKLRAAPSEKTLRGWKSFHYEKLQGDRRGFRSIRINDQYRIVFKLVGGSDPKIIIYEIGDYH